VQDKAGALYMAANPDTGPVGASRQDVTNYGLAPCLNMVNAPASHPVNQTVVGRGHLAWTTGGKGSKRYFIALVLANIPKGAKVPNYYRASVSIVDGDGTTGPGCPDGVSVWSTKDLRAWLAANRA
jgi:hypothetical protein